MSSKQDTYVHLPPINPLSELTLNNNPSPHDMPAQPVAPILEPVMENPVIGISQPPINPPPVDDPVEDNRPIALRRPKRTITAPWKVRMSKLPVLDSDDEEENAQAISSGISPDPTSYTDAVNGENSAQWKEAMLEEQNWHLENGTWSLVELPKDKKALGCKWVFRTKCNADGSIERYKARLVVLGNFQRPGQDFFETFASTLRLPTIRIVLALAAIEDMELRSIDISYAFTNSDIDVDIYMKQPEGFWQGEKDIVCKLNKSLYGLKQSP